MTNLPIIRINNAWLLRKNASEYIRQVQKGKPLGDDDHYKAIADEFRMAWKPYEAKILQSMNTVTGLTYRQNIIDVYIAPWFHAFSDPLVIGVIYEPDVFIDILTHELIHRLLYDNTTLDYRVSLNSEWAELFGDIIHKTTLIHIPVHAIHKAIYLDGLKEPKRLRRDIENCKEGPQATEYAEAWEYVEKHGYKQIISKLKTSYSRLSEDNNQQV